MLNYRKGVLFPEELRAIELHLAECELCNFALDGYDHVKDPESLINSLTIPALNTKKQPEEKKDKEVEQPKIVKKVEADLPKQSVPKKIIQEQRPKRVAFKSEKRSSGTIYKIAGVAAVLLIGFGLVWYFEFNNNDLNPTNRSELLVENDGAYENMDAAINKTDTEQIAVANQKARVENVNPDNINTVSAASETNLSDSNLGSNSQESNSELVIASNKSKTEDSKELEQKKDVVFFRYIYNNTYYIEMALARNPIF